MSSKKEIRSLFVAGWPSEGIEDNVSTIVAAYDDLQFPIFESIEDLKEKCKENFPIPGHNEYDKISVWKITVEKVGMISAKTTRNITFTTK